MADFAMHRRMRKLNKYELTYVLQHITIFCVTRVIKKAQLRLAREFSRTRFAERREGGRLCPSLSLEPIGVTRRNRRRSKAINDLIIEHS